MEQSAQTRDQDVWNALMASALQQLHREVIQSTSDDASGLLGCVEPHRGAHHSPDVFHVQHELSQAVCAPLATKERAANKAFTVAQEQLYQIQARLESIRRLARQARARPPQKNS